MKIADLLQELHTLTTANDTPQAFVGLCRAVYALKQCFAKEVTYLDTDTNTRYKFDDLMLEYGLDKTQTSRFLSSHYKYFDGGEIKSIFAGFTKWKLFYLLAVPSDTLDPDITAGRLSVHSTVKEIRKYVTANKEKNPASSANSDFDEADIPAAYNPSQHYDFAYFEEKTKAQLLNIVWELQKFVHKKKVIKQS